MSTASVPTHASHPEDPSDFSAGLRDSMRWWRSTGLSHGAHEALVATLPAAGGDVRSLAEQWLATMPAEQADAYLRAGFGLDEVTALHERGESIPTETLMVMAALLHPDDN